MPANDELACAKEVHEIHRVLERYVGKDGAHKDGVPINLHSCLNKIQSVSQLLETTQAESSKVDDVSLSDVPTRIFATDKAQKKAQELESGWNAFARTLPTAKDPTILFSSKSAVEVVETLRSLGSPDACLEKLLEEHPDTLPDTTSAIEKIQLVQESLLKDLETFAARAAALGSNDAYISKHEYLKLLETRKNLMQQVEYQEKLHEIHANHKAWLDSSLPPRQEAIKKYIQSCSALENDARHIQVAMALDPSVKKFYRYLQREVRRLRVREQDSQARIAQMKLERYRKENVPELVGENIQYGDTRVSEQCPDFWSEYDTDLLNLYNLERSKKKLKRDVATVDSLIQREYDTHIDLITGVEVSSTAYEIVTHVSISPREGG